MFESFTSDPNYSVSLVELTISLGIAGGGLLLAYLVHKGMTLLADITKRSRFQFDGIIVRITAGPVAILVGTLTFLYALRRLEAVDRYIRQWQGLETAIVILIVAWMLGNLISRIIKVYLQPYVDSTESDFDERLLYLFDLTAAYIIYVLGIAVALHTLGIQISAMLASLGIAGLAVALASKTILSNFFGGIILTVDRYIQPGHRVKIGEWIGDVEEITLYKTTLRTRDNLLVSIPNDVLMHQTTVNYNLPEALTRVELVIGVAYGTDLEQATEIITDIAEDLDRVSKRRDPEVNVVELGNSSINLKVLVWQDDPRGARHTRDEIYRKSLQEFEKVGIEIPYPHRDVAIRDSVNVRTDDPASEENTEGTIDS